MSDSIEICSTSEVRMIAVCDGRPQIAPSNVMDTLSAADWLLLQMKDVSHLVLWTAERWAPSHVLHGHTIYRAQDKVCELMRTEQCDPPELPSVPEGTSETREYAFDVSLFATIRVEATSEAHARRLMRAHIESAEANFGAWPNGDPILADVLVDGESILFQIDGEEV